MMLYLQCSVSFFHSIAFISNCTNIHLVILFFQSVAGDLMIRNIQLNHAGKYVCIVNTDVESLSAAADLIVKGKKMHLETNRHT